MDEESKRKMSRMVREDNDGTKQAAAKEAKLWRQQENDKNEDARKMASSNRQAMENRAKKMLDKEKPATGRDPRKNPDGSWKQLTQKEIDENNKKFAKFNGSGIVNVAEGK